MKTILQYEYMSQIGAKTNYFHKTSFNQSINIKNKHRFDFSYNLIKNKKKRVKKIIILFIIIFFFSYLFLNLSYL